MTKQSAPMVKRCWWLLGSHQLASILLGLLALVAALGGTLPQSARLSPAERSGWREAWSTSADWLDSLRLSDLFGAPWFWVLCGLLLVNLAAGTVQLVLSTRPWIDPWQKRSSWSLIAGHGGLLMLVAGAMASALTGFGAHLEMTEGEVWDGATDKLVVAQGRFNPFGAVLRLDKVEAAVDNGTYLRNLRLALSWQEAGGSPQQGEVVANRPITAAGYRIYPDNTFGQAALLERTLRDGSRRLLLVHFPLPRAEWGTAHWRAEQRRAIRSGDEIRDFQLVLEGEPARLQMVVSHGANPLFEGWLAPGESAEVAGERMTLSQIAPWAGLYLARDKGTPWVFVGIVLAVAGFFLHLAWSRDGVKQ